ncbi:hypothetical protein [Burkholderia multivorans]|uniref:hypothetical protein n=1 Tax=Burkholderia multivorans TaxID=87883 RepID=UPI0021C20754|nr:hypothetical protein [Burkholderia multivorans]
MEKMDAEELQERIDNNIKAIVPPAHASQFKEDLLWGNVSPFNREVGEEVSFLPGTAYIFTDKAAREAVKATYTCDGFAHRHDNKEPYIQSKDSFYFACLLSPKAEELIDYMKANMLAPTPSEHYDILAANLKAQHLHLDTKYEYLSINGVSQFGWGEMRTKDKTQHHEKMITKAIIDFNITEESIKVSQGDRKPLEGLEKYQPLLQRNKLEEKLAQKDSYEDMMRKLGIQHKDKQEQSITRAGKIKL